MNAPAAIAVVLAGCGLQDLGGGAGLDLGTGEVFACTLSPSGDAVELCWKDGDELELARSYARATGQFVSCSVTDRHLGPCIYGCSPHTGCNALNGCWCP